MILSFKEEFEKNCTPCGHHWTHGDFVELSGSHFKHFSTLLKCKFIDPNEFRVQNIISFDAIGANRTTYFLCNLADKYGVVITGRAQPNLVGPSITGSDNFYSGLELERLLKWYKYYGFECKEIDSIFHVKRSPKNEVQN